MILTLVEVDGADVQPSSAEALSVAAHVARQHDEPLEAVMFAATDSASVVLVQHEVSRVHHIAHPMLDDYSPELWGQAMAQLVESLRPTAVLAPGTDRGAEIMAHVAARLQLPLATNCTTVTSATTAWQLTRLRQAGMVLEDAELTASVLLATIAAGAVTDDVSGLTADVRQAEARPPIVTFTPEIGDDVPHSRLVERTTRDGGVSLATARVVVSGGRGVGSAEGFAPLEELAKLTTGAVGCSRVATNNGWRPHTDQVGQTGTKVSPDLYVACGISGATQHWVGCMGAKNILAVNTDPEAPLVTRASYAVIGDVAEVIPAIVEEIQRRASR